MEVTIVPLHLVTLVGGGDVYHKLVDDETWKYIFSPYRESKLLKGEERVFPLEEPPPNVARAIMRADSTRPDPFIGVGRNSYENDRALAVHCFLEEEDMMFYDTKTLIKFLFKHNIQPIKYYLGTIY